MASPNLAPPERRAARRTLLPYGRQHIDDDDIAAVAAALRDPLITTGPRVAAFERDLLERINGMGIGPAGLGGDTTALAVHVATAPCHIAALPVAVNLGCSAMRSMSLEVGA